MRALILIFVALMVGAPAHAGPVMRGTTVIDNLTVTNGVARSSLTAAAARKSLALQTQTIATTSTTDWYVIAPEAGTLASVDCSGIDALAAHGSNYITFGITNLAQDGSGSTALLAATDANTTKTTTGTALAANAVRALTVHGTAANLVVASGDRLRVRATATGTLANTVTGFTCTLRFAGTT